MCCCAVVNYKTFQFKVFKGSLHPHPHAINATTPTHGIFYSPQFHLHLEIKMAACRTQRLTYIECVRCHAIKYKIKNYATGQSQKIVILYTINKEDSSPSLRCVRRPKAEIFVEMFRTKLSSLVWSRHVGGPL